jgi:signal transduction histidine kinase
VPIFWNRILLQEMFSKLVENAIRHTPDSVGTVLSVRRDPEPCFLIEDSGRGIAADEHQKVFERFYRGSGAAGEGDGGPTMFLLSMR